MPLDIAAGIFLSLGVAAQFGIRPDALMIFVGIGSALFPDLDNMIPALRRIDYDHRSFFHWPLLYVPLAFVVSFVFGIPTGVLFFLGTLFHFVHDSIGIGWGVAWLAPLSQRKILFPERGRRKEYGWFMTWLPEQEPAMAAKWHDRAWLKHWYFRPTLLAFIEYTAFIISIIVLIVYYGVP